CQQHNGYPTF
nr:immunoglobulin light chain junction region [Macaca mulatta]